MPYITNPGGRIEYSKIRPGGYISSYNPMNQPSYLDDIDFHLTLMSEPSPLSEAVQRSSLDLLDCYSSMLAFGSWVRSPRLKLVNKVFSPSVA